MSYITYGTHLDISVTNQCSVDGQIDNQFEHSISIIGPINDMFLYDFMQLTSIEQQMWSWHLCKSQL